MSGVELITRRLNGLPIRSILTITIRCAIRVRILAAISRKDQLSSIDKAVEIALAVARGEQNGLAAWGAADAKSSVIRAFPPDDLAALATALAAGTAAAAAKITNESSNHDRFHKQALSESIKSIEASFQAADRAKAIAKTIEAVQKDLDKLPDLKPVERGLYDNKPWPIEGEIIDPSEDGPLGPLWPSGGPVWYYSSIDETANQIDPTGESELVIEVDAPEGASDEAILDLARRVALEADDFHRSLGGHGLKIDRLEVNQHAFVPEGVPRD